MRQIKFRAWHDGIKKMINVYVLSQQTDASGRYETDCRGWFGENSQVTFSLHEVVLEQFTGLKDKNGKEIYEGDIVKCADGTCEVRWQEYYWAVGRLHGLGEASGDVGIEVIGNRHQNPDLLN